MAKEILSLALIPIALVFLAVRPDWTSVSALVAASALYAFLQFHAEQKSSEIDKIKDQITEIKNKIEAIILGRGFGR